MYPTFSFLLPQIGAVTMHTYSASLWVALCCIGLGTFLTLQKGHNKRVSVMFSLSIILISLIGARIFHALTNYVSYQKHPSQIISLDLHGLSVLGAGIAVAACGFWAKNILHFPLWNFADRMIPYIGASIVIARIGCFLHGCCFGKVAQLPWSVQFPLFSEAHFYQISSAQTNLMTSLPVHPTQLYEAFGALLGVGLSLLARKYSPREGVGTLIFVSACILTRLITHYFRVFPESFTPISNFFPILYVSIFILAWNIYKNLQMHNTPKHSLFNG